MHGKKAPCVHVQGYLQGPQVIPCKPKKIKLARRKEWRRGGEGVVLAGMVATILLNATSTSPLHKVCAVKRLRRDRGGPF